MKQTYRKVLTFIACLLCGISAIAADYVVDGISYIKKTASTVWVNKTDGSYTYSGDIVIPSTITVNDTTFSVVAIASYAFQNCTEVTSITIEEGVGKIYDLTFSGCTALASVKLPESLTLLGNWCFTGCSSLEEITIPENCLSIYKYTFQDCTSLKKCKLPSKITTIPSYFFQNCTSLESIELPEGITVISNGCFDGCSSIASFDLTGITSIGYDAFQGTGFTEITIPESITSIGSSAFYNCSNLTTVNILGKANIGRDAFSFSSSITPSYITTLNAPNGLGTIGDRAFFKQKLMVAADLTLSGESVGSASFNSCAELSSVKINVTGNVASDAFYNCTKLDTIDVKCAQIESGAFQNCSAIVSATIDCDSILSTNAFNNLSSNCAYLNINCPTIPGGLFVTSSYNSTLSELILGEKVTNINNNFSSCGNLYSINIASPTPPANASFTAKQTLTTTRIILNGEWVEAYKQADGWKDFYYIVAEWDTTKATLIDGIYYNFTSENTAEVVAGENAYTGAVSIPATVEHEGNTYNVTAIRSEAFRYSKITSVSLPEGIEKIGVGAFYACNNLESITFPNSLTTLDACAFGISAITSITWGTGLTALNGMTFWKIRGSYSTELTIPASITSLGYGDFGYWFDGHGGTLTMESATPPHCRCRSL